MSQEKADNFIELAKYYAQTEKELEIQHWVYISIQYSDKIGSKVTLFAYNLPREVYERRKWVIEWRKARLICQYPKAGIQCYSSYYDKRLGNDPKLTADLRTLVSAKAQVTKVQKKIEAYLTYQREHNLFFDENADHELKNARQKLSVKIANVHEAEKRLKAKIEEIRQTTIKKK